MKRKLLKTILITILIITLSMWDFVILGQNISIAIAESNVKNVEFNVYLNQEGETKISSEPTLTLDINVKEKGGLSDAKIKIENSNFTMQKDKVQNRYIKNIDLDSNEIELNDIVYQSNVKLEIPIQFNKKQEFEQDYFQKDISIQLEGNYKGEVVSEQRNLTINWTEDADIILNQSIKKYKKIEDIGMLLQQEVTTEVTGNTLPRERETLILQVPILEEQQPRQIYVICNGVKLTEEKVRFKENDNQLEIENSNTLSWKNQINTYQVIYIYDQTIDDINRTLELTTSSVTKLFTKEEITKQETKTVEISPMGNMISLKNSVTTEVYKGYLYAGIGETVFTEDNKIEISNKEKVDEIELTKVKEEFSDDVNTFDMSEQVIYKSTQINPEEFNRILGADGQITITDEQNNILAELNASSLSINYETEVKNIKVIMSKPIEEGEITISHTRAIKGEQTYSKEELKTFHKMLLKTRVSDGIEEEISQAEVSLKDTKTEAKLEINNTNFSTLQTNENIHFLSILKSDSLEYDLYKNPMIRIVLPVELSVDVKNVQQLNAQEELTLLEPNIYHNEKGETVIEMALQGEQLHFESAIEEGIQISITADITIDKAVPSKTSEIQMFYQNENRQGEEFNTTLPIKLNSKYGVLMINTLAGVENIDTKVTEIALGTGEESKQETQEVTIVNNYENPITNVLISGKIPKMDEEQINGETFKSTFEMKLAQAIQMGEGMEIYYSEDEENWTQTPEDFTKIKAFRVELQDNKIEPQETIKITCPLIFPENLEAKQESYTNIKLNYNYLGDNIETNSTFCLKTEGEEELIETVGTEKTDNMEIQVQGRTGGESLVEGQEVKEGQGIKYVVKIKNTSQEEIRNLKMTATQENAIFYDQKVYHDGWDSISDDENVDYTRIEENQELTQKEIMVDSIGPGEMVEMAYQFSVKEVENENNFTQGKIVITADELESKEIETLKNPILTGKLKLQMRSKYEEEYKVTTNREYPFLLDINNTSNTTQKNVMLHIPVPEGFDFYTNSLFEAENYEFIEYKDREVILKIPTIEAKETISIRLGFQINSMDTSIEYKDHSLTYYAILGEEIYVSNEMDRRIYNAESDIQAIQYGSVKDEWIENGDKVTYTCEIENRGEKEKDIDITDYLPAGAEVQKAIVQRYDMAEDTSSLLEENEIPLTTDENGQNSTYLIYNCKLGGKEKLILTIDTIIDSDKIFTQEITNSITIYTIQQRVSCNEVTYKVRGKEEIQDQEATYAIQGVAWLDGNKNGLKEENETKLPGIPVLLMNEETGEIVDTVQTNNEGTYVFTELKKGKYFVIFQYDATKYRVTEYQKMGISNDRNSDIISKTISLQGREQPIAMTGTLELMNGNLDYIDAGFILGEKFDLKLDKYISKIIIQNRKETKVQQYNQAQLAKIELAAKEVTGTSIVIEYHMKITNEGEIPGYVNEIVDYKPTDLSFSSEMNKNWYQTIEGELCSQELSNQIINPGETKIVTLTLTKNMNQDNTGTIRNTAEIKKSSNDYAIEDMDSIVGNRAPMEDDMSTAEVIISIRTGAVMIGLLLMIGMITIIGVSVYFIKKKVL